MITTILLDLDNTLLGNNAEDFLPPFFAHLSQHFAPLLKGRSLQPLMHQAVEALLTNTAGEDNYTQFMAHFSTAIGSPIEELQPVLEQFYQTDYPRLKQFTTYRPTAAAVVKALQQQGYKLVLATNPLYHKEAIKQRMRWAGVADFEFILITALENSHACKPSLRYYREILGKVDSRPENCWMIGDDVINDINPAHKLGLKTWWIPLKGQTPPANCDDYGSLEVLLHRIQTNGLA